MKIYISLVISFTAIVLVSIPAFADTSLLEKGQVVFNEVAAVGCKSCHGEYAEGDLGVGPFIRGATEGSIRAAIEGIGEMVVIKMTIKEEEIKAVTAYVNNLGRTQVVRTLSKRGRFIPENLSIYPGTNVQLVIKNSSTKSRTYVSKDLGIKSLEIAGRSTSNVLWSAPDEEGVYRLGCTNCKLKDQFFSIEISKSAKKFVPTKAITKLSTSEPG